MMDITVTTRTTWYLLHGLVLTCGAFGLLGLKLLAFPLVASGVVYLRALRLRRCVTAAAYSQQYGYLDSHSAWLSCVHALRSWLPCCECRRARALARVCCMCNLAPAPSVTRIKLWSSRSRHDMTPAERRLQKNGQHVGAIGACAMTWSGMPLSRGSGHFCTCT